MSSSLVTSALERITRGEWTQAARELEQAAGEFRAQGRAAERAQCVELAAKLRRMTGDTAAAARLLDSAPNDRRLAAERAELLYTERKWSAAVEAWSRLLTSGLTPEAESAVLRRRAAAYAEQGRIEAAEDDYAEAGRRLDPARAPFVRIEQAKLLMRLGHIAETRKVIDRIEHGTDAHVDAEIGTLQAALARAAGDLEAAIRHARAARASALEAVAPTSYFGAAVELAEALRAGGDFTGAYGTLAAAWATLSDVIGAEVAHSWVDPLLTAYRIAWGELAFDLARESYEQSRKRAREPQ